MKQKDVILLSTADWDNPFWTNKQHVAVELSKMGHKVFYIDSLGLRRPSASKSDIKRILKRLVKAIRPPKKVRENIWVWSPIILPWHNKTMVRWLNRVMFQSLLFFWLKILGFKKELFWTYNPIATEFIDLNDFDASVYHCVDEITAQPGMPSETIKGKEKFLVENVDVVFVTAPKLYETRKVWNNNTFYYSNVADYEHFSKAMLEQTNIPSDLLKIESPRLGFIGAISGYKLDFNLLHYVATSHPEWSIVLIGEVGEGDPWTNVSELRKLPNIHFMGPRSYNVLPNYMKGFDVALLPNNINEYTDSMFPMKFFEYLAAGLPVVTVPLKAIKEFDSIVEIGDSNSAFVEGIENVINKKCTDLNDRLSVAKKFTYESRMKKMLDKLNEIIQ